MKLPLKLFFPALAISSLALAAPETTAPGEASKSMEKAKEMKEAREWTLTGTIKAIDAKKMWLQVETTERGSDGKEVKKTVDVTWTETTRLAWDTPEKTAAKVADLTTGAHVKAKVKTGPDGKNVATEIWLHQEEESEEPMD